MFSKTSSLAFLKFGEVFNDFPVSLNQDALTHHTLNLKEAQFTYFYYSDHDIYISCDEGLCMLVVTEALDKVPEQFVIHRLVRISKGMYYNFIVLGEKAKLNVSFERGTQIFNWFLDTAYIYRPIMPTVRITELLAFFYNVRSSHYTFPGEMHKYWELTYVDSGCLTTEVNDETYIIKSNELMVYAPGSFARQSTDNKTCSYLTIIFAMDLLKPEEEVLLSDRVFTADPEIRKAIDVFVRSNKSAHYEDLMLNSIDLIVTHLLRYNQDQPARIIPTPMQQKFESELLNEILVYVNENIYNSFNVEELCNHFAISRSSLQALFKNNLGVAPKQFISDMKLKKSRLLIKESKYTISEISNMLGYSSIHYFSRKFKSEYGMTPTEYAHKLID